MEGQASWLIRQDNNFRNNSLVWAFMFSISVHVILAMVLPNVQFEKKVIPKILSIELAPSRKPEPVTISKPTPTSPAPKPKLSKPTQLPPPKKRSLSTQVIEPLPSSITKPVLESIPPPAIITAAPKPETSPIITAPSPDPPKPAGANLQDIDTARNLYGDLLAREISKHKQYPRIAQMRGWQGEAKVDLQIDSSGNVLTSKIHDSSGYEVLDKQALEMVIKAAPFPVPPDALRGRVFNILVPVTFHLE